MQRYSRRASPLELLWLLLLPALVSATLRWKCLTKPGISGDWFVLPHDTLKNTTHTFGVKGLPPVIIYVNTIGNEDRVDCELALCDRGVMESRSGFDSSQMDPSPSPSPSRRPCPTGLLSADTIRYFWVRVVPVSPLQARVELGRAGEEGLPPLLSCHIPKPNLDGSVKLKFSSGSFWTYGCTRPSPEPSLGCLYKTNTKRYDFNENNFPISNEIVTLKDGTSAFRFLVRGRENAHVRLKTPFSQYFYEIDLNYVGDLAIQEGSIYKDSRTCMGCISRQEFRLFTVMYNASDLWLLEGMSTDPSVSMKAAPGSSIRNITSVSFGSILSPEPVTWLHGCRGEDVALQASLQSNTTFSPPDSRWIANETGNLINQTKPGAGCRVVHTYKYRFDQYFALSEEGVVNGSSSALVFGVLGRKDIHLQLVGEVPPSQDLYYEIDIDFYNRTNIDRARELKVASTQNYGLLSPTEFRRFTLEHNAISGDLIITSEKGETIISWRDNRPFPLRYFSVASGSSAGNDTTWVFGCPRDLPTPYDVERATNGCSRPLHTHVYSHSQYFSMEREGIVTDNLRIINFSLRARSSGHIRLEHVLPPALDAMFEVDIAHQGKVGIDASGQTMVSEIAPEGLLSEKQFRGFWIRQDLSQRSLEIGKQGQLTPLIKWKAPLQIKFLPIRFISFTTSRLAGNATWFYGCKGNNTEPRENGAEEEFGKPESSSETEEEDIFDESPERKDLRSFILTNIMKPPAIGTEINVHFSVEKIYLDDLEGMAVIRGLLEAVWLDETVGWNPVEFNNVQGFKFLSTQLFWTPDLYMYKGDSVLSGMLHVNHTGRLRWEAAAHLEAHCSLEARHWPQDEHECEMYLGLGIVSSSKMLRLRLLEGQGVNVKLQAATAAPLWDLQAISVELLRLEGPKAPITARGNNTIHITLNLRRNAPVFHKILLAPFIVLAAMCLLTYWVHEPLPQDKVTFGCFALVLLVLSFIFLEAACPPGLKGVPIIVELYSWCLGVLALHVALSAVLSAIARECPTRRPPQLLCRMLTAPPTAWILLLPPQQVRLTSMFSRSQPKVVGYSTGSNQVYVRSLFDGDTLCSCSEGNCSKQVAAEARHFWALLATACERISSLLCWVFLMVAAFVLS